MTPQHLDDVPHLPSFRRKWAAMAPADRSLVRLAFAEIQRNPLLAGHRSRLVRIGRHLVEIHLIICGYVLFTLCEVLQAGLMIVIDAHLLPEIDAPL
jgi:hypothetical protein